MGCASGKVYSYTSLTGPDVVKIKYLLCEELAGIGICGWGFLIQFKKASVLKAIPTSYFCVYCSVRSFGLLQRHCQAAIKVIGSLLSGSHSCTLFSRRKIWFGQYWNAVEQENKIKASDDKQQHGRKGDHRGRHTS